MVLGLFGKMFNVPRGVLEATFLAIDNPFLHQILPTTSLEATFLAIDKPFLHQKLPTTFLEATFLVIVSHFFIKNSLR